MITFDDAVIHDHVKKKRKFKSWRTWDVKTRYCTHLNNNITNILPRFVLFVFWCTDGIDGQSQVFNKSEYLESLDNWNLFYSDSLNTKLHHFHALFHSVDDTKINTKTKPDYNHLLIDAGIRNLLGCGLWAKYAYQQEMRAWLSIRVKQFLLFST